MPVFISSLERDRLGTATSHDGFHEKLTQQGRRKELKKKKKHNGTKIRSEKDEYNSFKLDFRFQTLSERVIKKSI